MGVVTGITTSIRRDVPWARLTVRHLARPVRPRRVYRVDAVSPPLAFGVHENNLVNLRRGIVERVFAVDTAAGLAQPPRPNPGVVDRELAEFARKFRNQGCTTTPWSREEFVATYVGRRAKVYADAAASLGDIPLQRNEASSRSFLKAEKIPFYAKGDPAPRLIHPRSPRYNVEVGVFLKRIEHEVYRRVDAIWGSRTILKGYNAGEVGRIMHRKFAAFEQPIAIGLDASRFDQHVSVDMLRWEHARYLEFYSGQDRETLAELLRWQLHTKCVATAKDGQIRYEVDGMRFSGDMNTGMGNCLLMCAMVWSWLQRRGVRGQLANNGDDCVVFLDRRDYAAFGVDAMEQWFLGLGFTMKVERPVELLEQVEFCQSHPVFDGASYVMVRKHRHAQAKDSVSIKPLDTSSSFDKWRLSVGLAGLSLTGGIPVQQEYYLALMRGAKGEALRGDPTQETGFMRFARGMERKYSEPTAAARVSYWLAFGVTPDQQEALEAEYRTITPVWHPPVDKGLEGIPNPCLLL